MPPLHKALQIRVSPTELIIVLQAIKAALLADVVPADDYAIISAVIRRMNAAMDEVE